jgi:hypothetical protein
MITVHLLVIVGALAGFIVGAVLATVAWRRGWL